MNLEMVLSMSAEVVLNINAVHMDKLLLLHVYDFSLLTPLQPLLR